MVLKKHRKVLILSMVVFQVKKVIHVINHILTFVSQSTNRMRKVLFLLRLIPENALEQHILFFLPLP